MSLLKTIKSDQLAARKRKDEVTASILTCIIGETDRFGSKETTDEQVISLIKKIITNNEDTANRIGGLQALVYRNENKILESYLPEQLIQLTEAEIRSIIDTMMIPGTMNKIGYVMSYFKENYPGQYDGKLVSKIAKEIL